MNTATGLSRGIVPADAFHPPAWPRGCAALSLAEYNRHEREAAAELRRLGEYVNARLWLRRNGVPSDWLGTPLEYALCEMPGGWVGRLFRALGLF